MDVHRTQVYFQAMEVISAQERLHELTTADWPRLKNSDRTKLHRGLHRAAFPDTYAKEVTPMELAKMLGAGRIN